MKEYDAELNTEEMSTLIVVFLVETLICTLPGIRHKLVTQNKDKSERKQIYLMSILKCLNTEYENK